MRWAVLTLVVMLAGARAHAGPRAYPGATAILTDPMASPYRVHVARMTEVSLTFAGPPSSGGGHELDRMLEVPVVAERGDRVRVLIEHDGARTLVWLAAADLAWAVTRPVRLAGRGDAGVWLTTGAPVTAAAAGKRRAITYDDGRVTVRGTVAAGALARVFPVSRPLRRTFGSLAEEIRVAPGGAVIHATPLEVEVVGRRGAWVEVEHRSRYMRVRGWVAADRLTDAGFGTFGTGTGSGFGMSHVERITVPLGACLYDRPGGDPVGVQLVTERRYAPGRDGEWLQVYVGTPWGTVLAWGHPLGDEDGHPRWATCTPPPQPRPAPAADDE
jgi:hypothetical protein